MTTTGPSGDSRRDASDHPEVSGGPSASTRVAAVGKAAGIVLALAAAFWVGSKVGSPPRDAAGARHAGDTETDAAGAREWTCSMHPEIRKSSPGNCPICGMALVPVTPKAGAQQARKVKYACAMMCIPPMDRPGKCPVCGMDMVPVEESGALESSDTPSALNVLSEISLSETAQKLARLEVTPVQRRFVAAEIRMVGKVDYDETRQRSIGSRVPGRLDKLYVDYTGVPVKKGEHLVYLYSPELLGAQQELIESAKAIGDAQAAISEELRRMRQESLAASRQKLQLWGLTAEQVREIEERGTPSDHMTIYAPIGGIVTAKRMVEGAYVETGTEIYTIADLSRVWVKLDAYELDLAWLRYGQTVEFATEAYPGDTFQGTIAFIDPVLSEPTRTAKVRVNVPNSDGRLKPGMFIRAVVRSELTAAGQVMAPGLAGKWICPMHPEVIDDHPASCTECGMPLVPAESLGYASVSVSGAKPPLVIPATAPLITGPRALVYVATPDRPGRYEGREVLLGPRAGEYYLVREGLSEEELVVTEGNLYLDSAAQILAKRSMMSPSPGTAPAGHAHGDDAARKQEDPTDSRPGRLAPPGVQLTEDVRSSLHSILQSYFAIHQALSHDDFENAKRAGGDLQKALRGAGAADWPHGLREEWESVSPGLKESGDAIASAASIAAARAAFEGVSNSLIALAKRVGVGLRRRVYVYHCPMAFDNRGARWLQDREGVENPYFGAGMFRCGVLKESIGVDAPAGPGEPNDD